MPNLFNIIGTDVPIRAATIITKIIETEIVILISMGWSIINPNKIIKYLKSGGIPIITGFQGLNEESRVTTLGRGGSDASAIMLAKFFNAEKCVIYTDVQGVYTTDPNKLNTRRKMSDK